MPTHIHEHNKNKCEYNVETCPGGWLQMEMILLKSCGKYDITIRLKVLWLLKKGFHGQFEGVCRS